MQLLLISRLHASASCCNGHYCFDGKRAFLDSRYQKTPEPIVTKICTGDYVGSVNLCANFGNSRMPGDFSAHAWNITLLSLFNAWRSVPYFFFLAHVHRSNAWTDVDGWWLKRRVFTQGSAFWVCEWWKHTLRGSTIPKTVVCMAATTFESVAK